MAFCRSHEASQHQRDGDQKAADAGADVSLQAAAARKHQQSDKQPAEVRDSQQAQQVRAATNTPSFNFSKASKAEATQALASVGLTNDLIQALLENFTANQLQACLESAQQMEPVENITAAATPMCETQAEPNSSASAAVQSSSHQNGALPGTVSQEPAEAAAQAAEDKRGSSLLREVAHAAGSSEASDAPPRVGVLLVSGSHVRHWLAAINMVGYLQLNSLQIATDSVGC